MVDYDEVAELAAAMPDASNAYQREGTRARARAGKADEPRPVAAG